MGIQVLIPLGNERVLLYSEIAGAIADLLLNAVLIPSMACRCGHWNRCGRGRCFCCTVLGTQKRSPFCLSEGMLWNHRSGTGYCKLSVGENDCSWIICITTCIGHLVFCST